MTMRNAAGTAPAVEMAVEPRFDFLSAEYKALFSLRNATVFQAPLWLDAVHRDLVPRLGARQHTVTVRTGRDRRLVAVLPLTTQRVGPLCVMQPADFGVSDANAVTAAPQTLEALAADREARRRLRDLMHPADVLFFRKVRREGFDVRRLFDGAVASPGENAAYHTETGGDFQAWHQGVLSRSFSTRLARLGRQAERRLGRYEHRLVTEAADIRAAFSMLIEARKGRFEGDLLQNPIYADFYVEFAVAGAATGDALTFVSTVDDEPVAMVFCVAAEDQAHCVLIGADLKRMGHYAPGLQLALRVIQMRSDAGMPRFDFGLGNTGYKSDFRAMETAVDNVTWSRSLAGSAASFVYHRSKPLKNTLRRLAPRLR